MLHEISQETHALLREKRIAHCKGFVNDENICIDMCDYRKSQAHHHPARIRLDRLVDKFANLSEVEDVVEPGVSLLAQEPQHGRVHVNVFAPGELRIEA